MAIEEASRELVVHKPAAEVHAGVLRFVADHNGDVETVADTYIEAEFGSKAKTVLKGAGIAASDDLPKKLEVYVGGDGGTTNLRLLVRATHRMGTWGAEDKYEDALSSFADRVVTALVT